jgi:NADH-quinone oxidoreductase subunit L
VVAQTLIPILFQDSILLATVSAIAFPFLAFVLIIVITRTYPRLSAGLAIGAVTVSLISALFLIINLWTVKHSISYAGRWLVSGMITIPFGFLLDPTSLLMLLVVAGISFLVQVYSLGYMSGDPGFVRYYGFQSLFAGTMMALTLSSSLLQLYFFWELVGLCSYLLIGFWYEKFIATEAGKKAFVMTRLGDVCFFIGLLLVLLNLGHLSILEMNGPGVTVKMSSGLITLSALLIFGGIVGKSAQFPLLTWLPDAMEGPTPVSALLHSATMVAAGVYLFARLFPFFNHSTTALTVFLAIGTLTMLMASTMAMVDRDIKKVWAYSTISQLGYMIMALAAGGTFAGIFHLTTHAGFKTLLFLCSGVWVHYYQNNDLFEIGRRSGRGLKIPMVCLVLACASLSGIPPFSGFFSKEAILGALADLNNPLWLLVGFIGVFLTTYYTFRPVFIILFPKKIDRVGLEKGASETPFIYWSMAGVLIILAVLILIPGFLEIPLKNFLGGHQNGEIQRGWVTYLSLALVLGALALAWVEFGRKASDQVGFVERIPLLRNFFAERWYLDHFYRIFLDQVIYRTFANLFTRNDRQVIDGGIDGFCKFTEDSGRVISYLQSGRLRYNLFVSFAVLALVSLYFFFA